VFVSENSDSKALIAIGAVYPLAVYCAARQGHPLHVTTEVSSAGSRGLKQSKDIIRSTATFRSGDLRVHGAYKLFKTLN